MTAHAGVRMMAARVGVGLVLAAGALVAAPAVGATEGHGVVRDAPLVPVPAPGSGAGLNGAQSSLNWAGYGVAGGTFSSVSGSWVQPAARCPTNRAQLAAFWVGLDGYAPSDPHVEQVGTDSDCVKVRGRLGGGPSYYAWFELYPAAPVFLPQSSYPVSPGDAISASVSVSGSGYLLHLADAGRWTYSTVQTPSTRPPDASAEWIAEAPTSCRGSSCRIAPLADFVAIGFSGARANGLPVSAFANNRITMANKSGKKVKALTSALASAGTGFSVLWHHT